QEGVLLADGEGIIRACNRSASRILGLPPEAVIGTPLAAAAQGLFHGDGSPVKVEDVPAAVVLRTGKPMSDVVLIVQRPDGGRSWVSANIEPLVSPDEAKPSGVLLTLVDVTQR